MAGANVIAGEDRMSMTTRSPRDRLIVALDVSARVEAEKIVEALGDSVGFYKIGYQLGFSGGLDLARELAGAGKKVFVDLKLLDISNTVEKGVESIVALGAAMTTVHAYPHAMAAAARAAEGSGLTVLAVTVLTSLDESDLAAAGYGRSVADLVAARARQALESGMGGIVSATSEASAARAMLGPRMAIVTPGIRPQGAAAGDQKRVATPAEAMKAGASHIVVGRPIIAAAEPRAAAEAILAEMAAAE